MTSQIPINAFEQTVKKFSLLLSTVDRLLAPGGCPWDRKQTLLTMRASLLEESCELIDAIDSGVYEDISEELGDLFFVALFLGRLAEKEGVTALQLSMDGIIDKLIRRHPHVFGDGDKLHSEEAVLTQWDAIKGKEREHHPKTIEASIPKSLPALTRIQRYFRALNKAEKPIPVQTQRLFDDEEGLARLLLAAAAEAEEKGFDAELCLRNAFNRAVIENK